MCVSQLLPAFLQVWLHTLQIRLNGQVRVMGDGLAAWLLSPSLRRCLKPHAGLWSLLQAVRAANVVIRRHLQQAAVDGGPAVVELCIRAPSQFLIIDLSLQFTKRLLSVFSLPPDASR